MDTQVCKGISFQKKKAVWKLLEPPCVPVPSQLQLSTYSLMDNDAWNHTYFMRYSQQLSNSICKSRWFILPTCIWAMSFYQTFPQSLMNYLPSQPVAWMDYGSHPPSTVLLRSAEWKFMTGQPNPPINVLEKQGWIRPYFAGGGPQGERKLTSHEHKFPRTPSNKNDSPCRWQTPGFRAFVKLWNSR